MRLFRIKSNLCLSSNLWGTKALELNAGKQEEWQWFIAEVSITHKTDHAGLDIWLEILGVYFEFKVYDSRHWNYVDKRYYFDGEEELEVKVCEFFKDVEKTHAWINTPTPMLGGMIP